MLIRAVVSEPSAQIAYRREKKTWAPGAEARAPHRTTARGHAWMIWKEDVKGFHLVQFLLKSVRALARAAPAKLGQGSQTAERGLGRKRKIGSCLCRVGAEVFKRDYLRSSFTDPSLSSSRPCGPRESAWRKALGTSDAERKARVSCDQI